MSAPAAVSRPIPARVLDLLLERRSTAFPAGGNTRCKLDQSANRRSRVGLPARQAWAERCQYRIQHLARLMGRARALEVIWNNHWLWSQ
jgi:hypothetical protein